MRDAIARYLREARLGGARVAIHLRRVAAMLPAALRVFGRGLAAFLRGVLIALQFVSAAGDVATTFADSGAKPGIDRQRHDVAPEAPGDGQPPFIRHPKKDDGSEGLWI